MDNRLATALAVAAGYALGRTKKGRLALGVGGMVLGKRLRTGPQQLLSAANEQLLKNPQLKEVGDQVREDLRGVGKAATGAVVSRRIDSLADRLHQRTMNVQDQLSGAPGGPGPGNGTSEAGGPEGQPADEAGRSRDDELRKRRPTGRPPTTPGKTAGKAAQTAGRTAPGKTGGKPAQAAGRTAPARTGAAAARTAARKAAAARAAGRPRGGDGHD